MRVFVTGGAGYIGSTTVSELLKAGHDVTVFDNLSMGHFESIPKAATFIEGDLANPVDINRGLESASAEVVIHFAANTLVGESMHQPFQYIGDNVKGSLNLLEAMDSNGVRKIVFSSTANLFDCEYTKPIKAGDMINPGSPYGESKYIVERFFYWLKETRNLRYTCLRYFNASGATLERGEDHDPETHLIPLVLEVAQGKRDKFYIYGDDYPTPDGTCVRDFIHISDLASAHLLAMEALNGASWRTEYNLGNGEGFSVKDVVETCRKVTGHPIPAEVQDRRPGDPAFLVADSQLIREELGWEPRFQSLDSIIQSAWEWHLANPKGYGA